MNVCSKCKNEITGDIYISKLNKTKILCENCYYAETFCITMSKIMQIDKKYKNINLKIYKEKLILEIYQDNKQKDLYKKLEIEKQQDKLKVVILPNKITKIMDIKELEELIFLINNQKQVGIPNQKEIKLLRKKYKPGTKVQLIKMYDYISPVSSGTIGSVDFIDDIGNIHMKWENGSRLSLIVGLDEFKILED